MVKFVIPWLPPSTNEAYWNLRGGGGRVLTTAGKKFKNEVQTHLARTYPKELMTFRQDEPYVVFSRIHLAELENANQGAKSRSKKRSTVPRYKKNDATNRIKVLEDVLADVITVDDSSTLVFIVQKVQAKDKAKPMVEVFIWNQLREESPFDEPLSRL